MKVWPKEFAVIVCERAGNEVRSRMSAVVHRNCFECGETVAVDPQSIAVAASLPGPYLQETKYLCVWPCLAKYDPDTIDQMIPV